MLSQIDTVNLSDIENKIRDLKNEKLQQDEEWKNRPLNVKFADSLILGDSHAESLVYYKILDDSEVIAHNGASLRDFSDNLDTIINLNPQNIFLTYGMNDLSIFDYADEFASSYENVIQTLHSSLPDTTVYVTLIFYSLPRAIESHEFLSKAEEYNHALIEMCQRNNIQYIDCNALLTEDCYDTDGIHMTMDFYTTWVESMAEVSGI